MAGSGLQNEQIRAAFDKDVSLEPFWWAAAPRPAKIVPELPRTVDVAVVGSGYSGLSAALTLAGAGRSVVVFERNALGWGASSRNGGAVGETLRISFATMVDRMGLDRALAYYTSVREAREFLEDLLHRERIRCHYARVGRFIGAHRRSDYEAMARDLELRKRHLGFDAEMVAQSDVHRVLGSDAYCGGRLINSDGNLHPGLFHQELLERVRRAGVVLSSHTPVTSMTRNGSGFRVETDRGSAHARDVVVASNAYTGRESQWLRRRLIPIQSQIIATEALQPEVVARLMPAGRQMGDTRKLHNYFRTSPDGRQILFGGRAGGQERDNPRASGYHLYRQLIDVFPELAGVRITHSWSGLIAYTFDSLPHMSYHDGIHYVGGCCGSGVAMATYLGHKAALKLLGSAEAATAFDHPYRTVPLYSGRPWFVPLATKLLAIQDRMGQ